jgi:hypothetical protein
LGQTCELGALLVTGPQRAGQRGLEPLDLGERRGGVLARFTPLIEGRGQTSEQKLL